MNYYSVKKNCLKIIYFRQHKDVFVLNQYTHIEDYRRK